VIVLQLFYIDFIDSVVSNGRRAATFILHNPPVALYSISLGGMKNFKEAVSLSITGCVEQPLGSIHAGKGNCARDTTFSGMHSRRKLQDRMLVRAKYGKLFKQDRLRPLYWYGLSRLGGGLVRTANVTSDAAQICWKPGTDIWILGNDLPIRYSTYTKVSLIVFLAETRAD